MENKTKNLFINAILLSITMMIMRSIGVVFNVYISNEIGKEGMGLYKLNGGHGVLYEVINTWY